MATIVSFTDTDTFWSLLKPFSKSSSESYAQARSPRVRCSDHHPTSSRRSRGPNCRCESFHPSMSRSDTSTTTRWTVPKYLPYESSYVEAMKRANYIILFWSLTSRMHLRELKLHTRIELSRAPLKMYSPSSETARMLTSPKWPSIEAMRGHTIPWLSSYEWLGSLNPTRL